MADTLRSLRAEIQLETRGDFSGTPDEDSIVNAAINDAVETIWSAMMAVHLARFFGKDSPVTFNLAANTERVRLINIADPTVAPTVGFVPGGALAQRNVTAAFTYVTESGSETLQSPTSNEIVPVNNFFTASLPITNANILNAIGWNLYAAIQPDTVLALQNQQPIPFTVQFQEPVSGLVDYAAFQQTVPLVNSTADNLSWIEHLEVRTSDTLLRPWNQVDIDSEVMRRMGRTLSSASEYQHYVWELTNDGVLEFRPQTGLAFTPRYWYVAKPRRLRYDQGIIPYQNIVGVHKFLKCQAKADLFLGVNEFLVSEGWEQKADKERAKIEMSLLMELWSKNTRIVPHLF